MVVQASRGGGTKQNGEKYLNKKNNKSRAKNRPGKRSGDKKDKRKRFENANDVSNCMYTLVSDSRAL
jgi:hypothetical protein